MYRSDPSRRLRENRRRLTSQVDPRILKKLYFLHFCILSNVMTQIRHRHKKVKHEKAKKILIISYCESQYLSFLTYGSKLLSKDGQKIVFWTINSFFFTKVPVIEEAPGGVDVIVNFIRVNCQDFFLSEMTKLISTWKQCENFDFNLNQSSKHDLK